MGRLRRDVNPQGLDAAHLSMATRSWAALMCGFVYAVFFGSYGGACAVTLVSS